MITEHNQTNFLYVPFDGVFSSDDTMYNLTDYAEWRDLSDVGDARWMRITFFGITILFDSKQPKFVVQFFFFFFIQNLKQELTSSNLGKCGWMD